METTTSTPSTESENIELLPCPFCGETKNLLIKHMPGTILHPAYTVTCDNCGARNGYTDKGDHRENWNTRPPDHS